MKQVPIDAPYLFQLKLLQNSKVNLHRGILRSQDQFILPSFFLSFLNILYIGGFDCNITKTTFEPTSTVRTAYHGLGQAHIDQAL